MVYNNNPFFYLEKIIENFKLFFIMKLEYENRKIYFKTSLMTIYFYKFTI